MIVLVAPTVVLFRHLKVTVSQTKEYVGLDRGEAPSGSNAVCPGTVHGINPQPSD